MTLEQHGADRESTLLAWWLDELDAAESLAIEQHLFECDDCAAHLRALLRFGAAVKRTLLEGRLGTAVTPEFIGRLRDAGLRLREYRVPAGGSVLCTISPDDDFVVSRLEAPLAGVRQVDLELDDETGTHRVAHLAFDAASDEVAFIPPTVVLRALGQSTQRMRLYAVTAGAGRLLGEYTFNHTPWVS